MDTAFDTSLRDLKRTWIPVTSLVLVAVGLTTLAVACQARVVLRNQGTIGDQAFLEIEARLDLAELSATPRD
jgi:hypothetical protein